MPQLVIDTDVYSIEEVAEEIIVRQETTGMPWKLAIQTVLESYVRDESPNEAAD